MQLFWNIVKKHTHTNTEIVFSRHLAYQCWWEGLWQCEQVMVPIPSAQHHHHHDHTTIIVIIWSCQVEHSVKHTTASLKHTVASTSAFNADHPDVYDLATDDRTERITRPS